MSKKELKDINYTYADRLLTTEVTFEDDSKIYVFVCSTMIFVADCDYTELSKRVEAESDDFEAYDTVDTVDYYTASNYAEYINMSLLYLTHILM